MRSMDPVEILTLIVGLPSTSRYAGRLSGERADSGWGVLQFLMLDIRNGLEGLRAQVSKATGSKGPAVKFREWDAYPGAGAAKRKQQKKTFDQWFSRATII